MSEIFEREPEWGNSVGRVNCTGYNGTKWRELYTDESTRGLISLSNSHHEIHGGDHFFIEDYMDLANGATHNIIIVTPNTTKWTHLVDEIKHELETSIVLTEAVATTSNGTTMTTFNNNRNSANTAGTLFFHTPTGLNGGTVLINDREGSDKKLGGGARGDEELILKQNTKYNFLITNETVNNNFINYKFEFYEHTDKAV